MLLHRNLVYLSELRQFECELEFQEAIGVDSTAPPEVEDGLERQTRRGGAQPEAGGAGAREDESIAGQASTMWNQTINQNPEISGVMKTIEKYIPFIIIVSVKSLFEHATGEQILTIL